ncbi:MAG: pyridoxal phosphate-dependent aminotransferase [Bacteroidota bacterium]
MPSISTRAKTVPLSPFRKLIPIADEAKANGVHVYQLNIGQPDILTPPEAVQQFKELDWDILPYSPSKGILSYRLALVDYFGRYGVDLHADQVAVTTGGSEALLLLFMACLDPGDELIIPEPFYANYNGFAHMAGVHIEPISCQIEDGFQLPSPEEFARKIGPKTKAIMITNPNNPTGACYSPDQLEQLADICRANGLFFFADEVYREFNYTSRPSSLLGIQNLDDQAVVIDSVSKRYSATGARVGAIASRNAEVMAAIDRFAKLRLSPPGLGQMLSECMLQNDDAYLDEVQEEYRNRRDLVYRRLQAMPGVFSYRPGGAFYCFARFPIQDSEHFCHWLLSEFNHKGSTVMLSPGPGFYATPGLGKDECRIAYVLNETELDAAMDCLEEALRVYAREESLVTQSLSMVTG